MQIPDCSKEVLGHGFGTGTTIKGLQVYAHISCLNNKEIRQPCPRQEPQEAQRGEEEGRDHGSRTAGVGVVCMARGYRRWYEGLDWCVGGMWMKWTKG